jgi:SAM-dependent methyltransferase
MATSSDESRYLLGSASTEHDRLVRQASILDPLTERLFRDAGVGPGQRVLDVGSGVGDVAILTARLVGPSGSVVGIERDETTLAKARSRIARAGLLNVSFVLGDIGGVALDALFDAIVGRLILEYIPKPSEVLSALAKLLRPGGVMVFQDACWGPWLEMNAGLQLRRACVSLIIEAFALSGAHMDMELVLFQGLQTAGLPPPTMRLEVPIGEEPNIVCYAFDLFSTLLPRMRQYGLDLSPLGDLDSLNKRLEAERVDANSFAASVGLVGAWSTKPQETASAHVASPR